MYAVTFSASGAIFSAKSNAAAVTFDVVSPGSVVSSFLCRKSHSRHIAMHGSPSAFSGGGVGSSFWRPSVLCAKRKR